MQVYLPINPTDNVFSELLDNLYNKDEFKQNITQLETGTDSEKKKADLIKNTVNTIRVYGNANEPLLLAKDVGILMGITDMRFHLRNCDSSQKVIGSYQSDNGKITDEEFLTLRGFNKIAHSSRSVMSKVFQIFVSELLKAAMGRPIFDEATNRVIENNPELVEEAFIEYENNLNHLKLLYEKTDLENKLLKERIDNETQLRLIAEKKRNNAELTALIQTNVAKKTLEYKNHYETALLKMYEELPSTHHQVLDIVMSKFLKPLYIYAPHPKLYKEWLMKKNEDISDFIQYIPEYPDRMDYIINRLNDNKEKNLIKCILPETEHSYFYLHTSLIDDPSFIHIGTERYLDKKHIEYITCELNKYCQKINIKISNKNRIIYYTSLNNINQIIMDTLIKLN
jgi:prophage antirepressor-like protein